MAGRHAKVGPETEEPLRPANPTETVLQIYGMMPNS